MIKPQFLVFAPVVMCLFYLVAFAEPETYEASIEVRVSDVRSVLASLNDNLDLRLDVKTLADDAESLRVGLVYMVDFDMHFDGAVFQATYQIAKPESGRLGLTFSSFQKNAITAICQELARLGDARDSEHSPESCDYERPIEYKL